MPPLFFTVIVHSKRLNWILILVLFTANFAVFLPSMTGGFIWDDRLLITENPGLHDPLFLQKFLVSPFGGHLGLDENSLRLDQMSQFYRPVTSLSYWLDYKLWGLNPAAFHLSNIFFHIINCLILFFIFLALDWNPYKAFMGSLLFSLFPLHFENVSWISGRTDLLSFLFAALSVLLFIHFFKKKRSILLGLSAFFYFFSLLAKENTLFLPLIFLFIIYHRDAKIKDYIRNIFPYTVSLLLWFVMRSIALSSGFIQLSGRTISDFLSAIGFYTLKILFPFRLSLTIDSAGVFQNKYFFVSGLMLSLLFLVSLLLLLKNKISRIKPALMFTAFFLSLFPSVLVIFSAATVSFLAWRFLYLPSALFAASAVMVLSVKIKWKYLIYTVLLIGCIFYTLELYPKNKAFGRNEKEFWLGLENRNRENFLALFNIGIFSLPENEEQALEIFQKILKQKDHHLYEKFRIRIYEELASYYTFHDKLEQAEYYFNRLLDSQKGQSQHFYVTYACFLAQKGKVDEGENIIRQMLNVFSENHLILLHAAKFYIILKDYEKAIELLKKDFALFPTEEIKGLLNQIEKIRKAELHIPE